MSFSGDNPKIMKGTFNLGHPIQSKTLRDNKILKTTQDRSWVLFYFEIMKKTTLEQIYDFLQNYMAYRLKK